MIEALVVLAIYRLTFMLVYEVGPYEMFGKLRLSLEGKPWNPLDCFYCTSIWVAAPFALFTSNPVIYWLAYSACAIILYELLETVKENR